jgi:hypothetical protein
LNETSNKTFEVTIKFLCQVRDREDAMARTRLMFGDLPLPGLRIDAARAPQELERKLIDRDQAKAAIEADADRGVSFVEDIMGHRPPPVKHPWEQGAWIFPDDHPLAAYEKAARAQNDTKALATMRALTEGGQGGSKTSEEDKGHVSLPAGPGDGADTEDNGAEDVEGELL